MRSARRKASKLSAKEEQLAQYEFELTAPGAVSEYPYFAYCMENLRRYLDLQGYTPWVSGNVLEGALNSIRHAFIVDPVTARRWAKYLKLDVKYVYMRPDQLAELRQEAINERDRRARAS